MVFTSKEKQQQQTNTPTTKSKPTKADQSMKKNKGCEQPKDRDVEGRRSAGCPKTVVEHPHSAVNFIGNDLNEFSEKSGKADIGCGRACLPQQSNEVRDIPSCMKILKVKDQPRPGTRKRELRRSNRIIEPKLFQLTLLDFSLLWNLTNFCHF